MPHRDRASSPSPPASHRLSEEVERLEQRDDRFVRGGLGDFTALVGCGQDAEVPGGGQPDRGVPGGIATVVAEGAAAGPGALDYGPAAGIFETGRWRLECPEGGSFQE